MVSRYKLPLLALCALGLFLLAACSKSQNQSSNGQETSQSAATSAPIDPNTAATISGTVKYTGAVPKPVKIDMSQDPGCKGENTSEVLVVQDGNLANAYVYVKDGLGNRTFQPPQQPVVLNQEGCRYQPHVLALMVGQPLDVKNDDSTAHNVHPMPRVNEEWNESQPPKAPDIMKTFSKPEVMMQVKCNQHPWMKGYINVASNPFFAVTDSSGKFELKGLPPGEYTIAVVHERLGEQTQKVTVGPKETKTIDFTYGANATNAGL